MENTSSIAKGVFVFKNGVQPTKKKSRKKKQAPVEPAQQSIFGDQLWYQSYSSQWNKIDCALQELNKEMFSSVLSSLLEYVRGCYTAKVTEIPAAALLTGINMPDHAAQFSTLGKQIKSNISPHVACLYSQDCQNLKSLIENMIMQVVDGDDSDSSEDEETENEEKTTRLKKSQCNFALLQTWYENQYPIKSDSKKCLAIIIPDFESFNPSVLQEFILIISSYINILPFVLIFGVATSLNILHRSLPYHVSSKINIHVFNSQPSTKYLNNVIEQVLFSKDCVFHLGGKVFQLFTDIFLFYDFSVTGFVQNFKYAMLEHYSQNNTYALCTSRDKLINILEQFSDEDIESVRHLMSFRRLVESESYENRIKLIEDDDYFLEVFANDLLKFHNYLDMFHLYLKCLFTLTSDLPKNPLGKQLREVYRLATVKDITRSSEYKDCMQLLGFQSKDELSLKVISICELLIEEWEKTNSEELLEEVEIIKTSLDNLNDDAEVDNDGDAVMNEEVEANPLNEKLDRNQLKAKLLQMSKQNKPLNRYERLRSELLKTLHSLFEKHLVDPTSLNFHEIFFFNDISIQTQIVGSHRAAIHTALNNPHYYLQCTCCDIPNDSVILRTMPDICIAYKLHMEYGKMINLYDWLQAFLSIVDPVTSENDEPKDVDPTLQARFTQAVAELEFLGFIKSSKRKADHVARLTWGG